MDKEVMDYSELVEQIRLKADTQIPALLSVCVKEIVRREIFVNEKSLTDFVQRIIDEC